MKKRIYTLSMTLALILTLCACEKTPDEKIVAGKNSDRLKEEAQKGADESNNLAAVAKAADKHYTYTYENEEKTFKVEADADVWLPDKDAIPMYEVESSDFSQELVTKVYDYLFDGAETYTWEGTDASKSVIEERIVEAKEEIAKCEADDTLGPEEKEAVLSEWNQRLEIYEESYPDAPEQPTLTKIPVDSTLTVLKNMQMTGVDEDIYGVECESDNAYFNVTNAPLYGGWGSHISYQRKITYPQEDGDYSYSGVEGKTPEKDRYNKLKKNIGISYEEALAKSSGLFEAAGVDVELMDVKVLQGAIWKTNEEDKYTDNAAMERADKETAWQFFFTRKIDGIPLAITENNEVGEDSIIWIYERINVIVDKKGIHAVNWEFPTNMVSEVSENVGILSFDEAKAIFEKMVPIVYEGELERFKDSENEVVVDVGVDSIRLCLMRVRDSGGERTGVLTPAWIFYGQKVSKFHTYDEMNNSWTDWESEEYTPYIVLAVNAVDGSIIDIVEGY